MTTALDADLDAYLPRFGLTDFRPGQREVIAAVMAGQDCLCIMPTGGGKSLCYQLPSIARPGLTLVVSPLIALMKDQVDALQRRGLRATFINSTLAPAEQQQRLDGMAAGHYDLVYVVPERFRSPRFLQAVGASRLQLLAIDEAHCVSQWGHDFRPDYARLGQFRQRLGNPPTIALTATATNAVRDDIIELLALRNPLKFVTGFARPNLHYEVRQAGKQSEKDQELLAFLRQNPGSGIIYANTRKRCEAVLELLRKGTQRRSAAYHAGLDAPQRRQTQEAFMRGEVELIVATNAFGMGIDKPNVRFVIHYNIPGTIEAYYQEAGRAGRDGLPSRCLLLYAPTDRRVQEFFIDSAYPSREVLAQVYNFLRNWPEDPIECTQEEIRAQLGLEIGADGVGKCVQILEQAGALRRLDPCQNMAVVSIHSELPTLVDLLPQQAKTRRLVLRAVERLVGDRRFELVYFNRNELLRLVELDAAALARALGRLRELDAFDYVPPFRGRALHMFEPRKKFDELEIDFELLARRKAAEHQKLKRVCRFAESAACRQQEVLDYFGQQDHDVCRQCDNCRKPGGAAAMLHDIAATEPAVYQAVLKVLSAVARTHGRFGRNVVAQLLCGSKSATVTRFKLNRIPTYGALKCLKQGEAVALIDALLDAECLLQIDMGQDRPIVQLTDHGQQVMRGRAELGGLFLSRDLLAKLTGRRESRREAAPVSEPPAAPSRGADDPIQVARSASEGVQPPDAEPAPLARAADFQAGAPTAESAGNGQVPRQGGPRPSHYWTWRLLQRGFAAWECAAIRGLTEEEILDHAVRAAEEGRPVEMGWLISPQQAAVLGQLIGPEPPDRIRPLLDRLPDGLRREHVEWFLKCR